MEAGKEYWIAHQTEAYVLVKFKGKAGDTLTFEENGNQSHIKEKDAENKIIAVSPDDHQGIENICSLRRVTVPAILSTLKARFMREPNPDIYTDVADILIAVNPFKKLAIFSDEYIEKYKCATELSSLNSHIFRLGQRSVNGLRQFSRSQVVLISGESGAGKTESTKLILNFVSKSLGSRGRDGIQEKILQTSPILESFGNALTSRNKNSSRFGKFIEMSVDKNSAAKEIMGCQIQDYLLEQPRITAQTKSERNYHVFYQMLKHKDYFKGKVGPLGNIQEYTYLKTGYSGNDVPDDKVMFDELIAALRVLDFGDDAVIEIFKVVLAILTIGNTEFKEVGDGSQPKDNAPVITTSALLGIGAEALTKSLVTKVIGVGSTKIEKTYNPAGAKNAKESFSRLLYSKLFKLLATSLNKQLAAAGSSDASVFFGVLDIAGFESFEFNSLEQLFINLGNEHLQAHFNQHIFKHEIEDYKREGVCVDGILTYKDNTDVIDLIDSKNSLLGNLDEELNLPKGNDKNYLTRIVKAFGKHVRFITPKFPGGTTFSVSHFAGVVEYDVTGWLEKNTDIVPDGIFELFDQSPLGIMKSIAGELGKQSRKKKAKSVGQHLRSSLSALMLKVNQANPSFVRCIKPNSEKVPGKVIGSLVVDQLNFSGVLEAVKIRQNGFPVRMPFEEFVKMNACLAPVASRAGVRDAHPNAGVAKILAEAPAEFGTSLKSVDGYKKEDIQIGKTMVFLRSRQAEILERGVQIRRAMGQIQIAKVYRGYRVRNNLRGRTPAQQAVVGKARASVCSMLANRKLEIPDPLPQTSQEINVKFMDHSVWDFDVLMDTTVFECIEIICKKMDFANPRDWSLFQTSGNPSFAVLLPSTALISDVIASWDNDDPGSSGGMFLLRKRFLSKTKQFTLSGTYESNLTWAQAREDFLQSPVKEPKEWIEQIAGRLLRIARKNGASLEIERDFLDNGGQLVFDRLCPACMYTDVRKFASRKRILDIYEASSEENSKQVAQKCFRLIQHLQFFGCMWWRGEVQQGNAVEKKQTKGRGLEFLKATSLLISVSEAGLRITWVDARSTVAEKKVAIHMPGDPPIKRRRGDWKEDPFIDGMPKLAVHNFRVTRVPELGEVLFWSSSGSELKLKLKPSPTESPKEVVIATSRAAEICTVLTEHAKFLSG